MRVAASESLNHTRLLHIVLSLLNEFPRASPLSRSLTDFDTHCAQIFQKAQLLYETEREETESPHADEDEEEEEEEGEGEREEGEEDATVNRAGPPPPPSLLSAQPNDVSATRHKAKMSCTTEANVCRTRSRVCCVCICLHSACQ